MNAQHNNIYAIEERYLRWSEHLRRFRSNSIPKMILELNSESTKENIREHWTNGVRKSMFKKHLTEEGEEIR